MKKLLIIVLLSITLTLAIPLKNDGPEAELSSEDGWFIPQANGSLVWVTEEEAQLKMRDLSRSRWFHAPIVRFFLYTKKNPNEPVEIFTNDLETLKKSGFQQNARTRIITHGWQNDYLSDVNVELRNALLETDDCNVISVDWSDKAGSYMYFKAVYNVPEVGMRVAQLIDFLIKDGKMSMSKLKLIGHSLGAHVSGFAGKNVLLGKIPEIIGLDPAWPLYTYKNCNKRLCESDATYVESIHTNGGLLGILQPVGKAAFYPNGGKTQPGCGWDLAGSCSHSRSFIYYAEAIRVNEFPSLKCSDYKEAVDKSCGKNGYKKVAQLGSKINSKKAYGAFYTPVNDKAPFRLGTVRSRD